MKGALSRKLLLLFLIFLISGYLALAIVFQSLQPFSAIASNSMAPAISTGDLILVKKTDFKEVKVGDVIIFKVPKEYQGRFGYPGTIAHRVVRIENDSAAGTVFWTKGDNTEMDPFGVTVGTIKGKYQFGIPFAGYAVMFFRSANGLIFLAVLTFLYLLYFLSERFEERLKNFLSGKPNPELLNRLNDIEKQNSKVNEALDSFANAMGEYAKHLSSHTKAVIEMAEAAKELKESAKKLAETKEK